MEKRYKHLQNLRRPAKRLKNPEELHRRGK
jgi:hypothetical protein